MKARKFLAFVAAAGMLFAGGGCTPNEEGEPATSEALVYVLSSESMTALSGEETVETIELTTNGSWDVVVPEEHSDIVVTPLNGKGNAIVTVTVPAYEGDRTVTLTFNFSKKTSYPVVGVIDENQSLTFTISQNASGVATTPIANLVAGESATVVGVLSAVGSKASILTDATGSVVLYGNPDDNYVVGTKLTVIGTPVHHQNYPTNALQIAKSSATIEVGSAGNTVDYNPQVLSGAEVDQLVGADAVCTEVQFEGTVVIGQYANVSIEGASKQASLYYVTAADYEMYNGVKVVVKGYVTGTYNYLNVLPYSVETTEKIIYCKDIAGVSADGVENETVTIQTLNITGEVSAEGDGQIVTAASVDGNVLTYTVAANNGDARDGEITLSADGVEKKVKVSQLGLIPVKVSEVTKDITCIVEGVVVAAGTSAYVLADETGALLVYGSGHERTVGDKVKVTGEVSRYQNYDNNALQMKATNTELVSATNDWDYDPTVVDGAALTTLVGGTVCTTTEVQVRGVLAVADGKATITVEGATAVAELKYVNVSNYSELNGKTVIAKGYITGIYNSLQILPYSVEATTDPYVKAEDILNVPAAGVNNDTTDVTIENITAAEITVTCDETVVTEATLDGTTLTYTVAENTGAAREGWISLTAEGVDVKIKVTQKAAGDLSKQVTIAYDQASGNTATSITKTADDITIVIDKNTASSNPNEYKDGTHVRVMGGSTITITGGTIKKVVMTCTSASYVKPFSANTGTVTNTENIIEWTGETTELVLTNTDTSQARVKTIEVIYIE